MHCPETESVPLRRRALNLIETVGQPLAAIAPTLTSALNISIVAGLAGLGCWMSYPIGTLGEYLYNMLPYLFFAYMTLGGAWFAALKSNSPHTLASIEHDMEG